MPLFTIHLCVVYGTHMLTSLWDFCTHQFITYVYLKYLYYISYSLWDFYTQFCFSLFISHTNGICTSVSSSIFFYIYDYVCICDQCHGGIIAFMWLPHSLICICSRWVCERKFFSNSIWFFWLPVHMIFDPLTSMKIHVQ